MARVAVLDEALKLAGEAVEEDALGEVVHGVQEALEDDARLVVAGEGDLVARERLERRAEEERALVLDLLLDLVAVLVDDELRLALPVTHLGHLLDLLRDAREVGLGVGVGFGERVRVGHAVGAARARRRGERVPLHLRLALAEPPLALELGGRLLLLLLALDLQRGRETCMSWVCERPCEL